MRTPLAQVRHVANGIGTSRPIASLPPADGTAAHTHHLGERKKRSTKKESYPVQPTTVCTIPTMVFGAFGIVCGAPELNNRTTSTRAGLLSRCLSSGLHLMLQHPPQRDSDSGIMARCERTWSGRPYTVPVRHGR